MWRKRKFQRIEDPTSVQVKLYSVRGHEDLNGSTLTCHTNDISEGGVCLAVNRRLPVNTEVKLRLAISDPPSSFTHKAEVRWSRNGGSGEEPYSAGLEFIDGSETHMEEWRRLLRVIAHTSAAEPAAAQV